MQFERFLILAILILAALYKMKSILTNKKHTS